MAWSLTLGEGLLPPLMMIGGVVLASMLLIINMRRRQKNLRAGAMSPRDKIEQAKQTHAMRGDLRQMMVELEDLTRRFSAQLDAKSLRLEKLTEEADRRIARLEQLQSEAPAPAAPAPPAPAESKPARSRSRSKPKAESASDSAPAAPPVDPLARQIYQLADAGQSSIQIAKRLDEQIGKIELILALRQ